MLLAALEFARGYGRDNVGICQQIGFLDPAHAKACAAPFRLALPDVMLVSAGKKSLPDQRHDIRIVGEICALVPGRETADPKFEEPGRAIMLEPVLNLSLGDQRGNIRI